MASELGKVYVSLSHLTGKFQVMPLKPDGTVNLNVYAQARTLSFNTFEDAVKYAKGLVAHYGGTVESDTRGKSVNSRPGAKDMMAASDMTTPEAIAKMMEAWNKIEAQAKKQFPNASKEELYRITKSAMESALKSKFSRPGAKARFKVEDRFYFGKGRKERFAEIDVVNQLMQLAMKEGMADRMGPEIDRVLGSGSFDKLFKSYKSALISKRIMELKRQGKSTPEAFDLVLGAGAYKNMVGELYDALRAKASSKHSRPGKPERFADDRLTKFLEVYKRNEDNNLHSENVLLLAKFIGSGDQVAQAQRILNRQNRSLDGITEKSYEERKHLNRRLLLLFRRRYPQVSI